MMNISEASRDDLIRNKLTCLRGVKHADVFLNPSEKKIRVVTVGGTTGDIRSVLFDSGLTNGFEVEFVQCFDVVSFILNTAIGGLVVLILKYYGFFAFAGKYEDMFWNLFK